MLHVIYRSYGGENRKGRPDYYSKLLALASFLRSFAQAKGEKEVIFLNDGPIPAERLRLMERHGEIVAGSNMRIYGSLRAALSMPAERKWDRDDLVWLAEDDYLYLAGAMDNLVAAKQAIPEADYFGLYALVGGRQPNGTFPVDDRIPEDWRDTEPVSVEGALWRRALSTTSTFGAKAGALADDRAMMSLAIRTGGAWDHTTSLAYQGFTPYEWRHLVQSARAAPVMRGVAKTAARVAFNAYAAARLRAGARRRLLVSADPALITHMEAEHLALGMDWRRVADDTQAWLAAQA